MEDFRELDAWKQCQEIRVSIWQLHKRFPSEEKYKLSDQIVRASRSATACIAEGYGRFHYQENIQYCRQSRGSLYELIDHLLVARECDYIDEAGADELTGKIKRAIQTLNGYIRYLKGKKSEI